MMTHILKQHIGYWMNRLRMEVHQSFEHRLSAYDVTIAQWCILVALYDRQATSVNELATYIEVDKASVSRVVERLVTKSLVSHTQGKDRRSGYLELTSEGRKLVPLLIKEADQNEQNFFGHLTETESGQLQNLVRKILTIIPSITLDGWLNLKENSMSQIDQIATMISQAKEHHWPYPKQFQALQDAGVTSYTVNLADFDARYYGAFGEWKRPVPPEFHPLRIASVFSATCIEEALKQRFQGKRSYFEFLADITAAGVSHYRVDMKSRTVTYYDGDEHNKYVQQVPAS